MGTKGTFQLEEEREGERSIETMYNRLHLKHDGSLEEYYRRDLIRRTAGNNRFQVIGPSGKSY